MFSNCWQRYAGPHCSGRDFLEYAKLNNLSMLSIMSKYINKLVILITIRVTFCATSPCSEQSSCRRLACSAFRSYVPN